MTIMKKIIFIALMTVGLSGIVCAQQPNRVPARPGVIERGQPSGDTLHICLRGDERSHYTVTADGWQIKEDASGTLCYAQQKKDGSIVASKKVAHDADKRSKCENKWLQRKGIKKG